MDNDNTASLDTFITALGEFVTACQADINEDYARLYPNQTPSVLSVDPRGKKYIRIVITTHGGEGQRGVFGFVERATGNLLKAAGWEAPSKNFPRGNIYSKNNRRFRTSIS